MNDVEPLREDRFGQAGRALARAFADDPLWCWVLPDDDQRDASLEFFQTAGVRYGHRFGAVHANAEPVLGCAVWLPPGETDLQPDRLAETGFHEAAARLDPDALERFLRFTEHLGPLHHRHMPGRHWYLMILGVDPAAQGRGLGGRLMAPILARADEDALPCYLETQKERNVPFYRKSGFEVVGETDVPEGPHLWLMSRPPARAER
jgi:ribosomal protein S18 acetylase RimI-like enzyme